MGSRGGQRGERSGLAWGKMGGWRDGGVTTGFAATMVGTRRRALPQTPWGRTASSAKHGPARGRRRKPLARGTAPRGTGGKPRTTPGAPREEASFQGRARRGAAPAATRERRRGLTPGGAETMPARGGRPPAACSLDFTLVHTSRKKSQRLERCTWFRSPTNGARPTRPLLCRLAAPAAGFPSGTPLARRRFFSRHGASRDHNTCNGAEFPVGAAVALPAGREGAPAFVARCTSVTQLVARARRSPSQRPGGGTRGRGGRGGAGRGVTPRSRAGGRWSGGGDGGGSGEEGGADGRSAASPAGGAAAGPPTSLTRPYAA